MSEKKHILFTAGLYLILHICLPVNHLLAIQADMFQTDTLITLPDSLQAQSISPETIDKPLAAIEYMGRHELTATHPFVEQQRVKDTSSNLITIWILISLLIIGLAKYIFPTRFKETLLAIWESRYFTVLERESGLLNHWVSLFLYINYLFSISLLFYQSLLHTQLIDSFGHTNPILLLVYGFGATAIFYFLKFLLMYFSAWVFRTEKPTELFFRNILLVNKFTGIAILPLLIINLYNPAGWILYTAWIVTALLEFYRLIRVTYIGMGMRGFSAYHLILYLCAIEIAPLLFLIKYSETWLK